MIGSQMISHMVNFSSFIPIVYKCTIYSRSRPWVVSASWFTCQHLQFSTSVTSHHYMWQFITVPSYMLRPNFFQYHYSTYMKWYYYEDQLCNISDHAFFKHH